VIVMRACDARFPDYPAIIPMDDPRVVFTTSKKALREELKIAVKYANASTNQVAFNLNGKATLHSQDVDFSHEYTAEIPGEYNEPIRIAFNGKFLDQILDEVEGDEVRMHFWTPSKCTIINDHFLLMPLMLNE
jgi:DNA polymerase-3 subunit beta